MKIKTMQRFKRIQMRAARAFALPILFIAFIATVATLQSSQAYSSTETNHGLSLHPFVKDLPPSWAIKVSPDNYLYVTKRSGQLAKYNMQAKLVGEVDLQLPDLFYKGQGGLMALAFHPDYDNQPWVYLSYSFGTSDRNGLKVIRILLEEPAKTGLAIVKKESIFEQTDLRNTPVHYGARLAFMADKSLLVSTGDGFDFREKAQKMSSDMGKVLRLSDTGTIPSDNPYVDAKSFSEQAIFSLGHRNPQGLIVLPNNKVIAHEHGPAGGDEINIIAPSLNYGWPVITQGKDYIGSLITPFTEYPGMQQPNYNWTPSIAPSGMDYYSGAAIPQFTGRLLVTSLKFKQLHSLNIEGDQIGDEHILFSGSEYRMRDVSISSSGRVFILSDGDDATIFEVLMTH